MRADSHVHTHFSYDADKTANMRGYLAAAAEQGIDILTFTDHSDFGEPFFADYDREDYFAEYREAAERSGVEALCGIECGLTLSGYMQNAKLIETLPYDYVLASQHIFGGVDVYSEPSYYACGREAAYKKALVEQYGLLTLFPDWDAVAHLGYFCRYYPGEDRLISYADAPEELDAILSYAAKRGKALEVNTRGWDKLGSPIPPVDILKRFIELGGERFTLGSDSHRYSMLYGGLETARECIAAAGGRYFCTYKGRKARFHKI